MSECVCVSGCMVLVHSVWSPHFGINSYLKNLINKKLLVRKCVVVHGTWGRCDILFTWSGENCESCDNDNVSCDWDNCEKSRKGPKGSWLLSNPRGGDDCGETVCGRFRLDGVVLLSFKHFFSFGRNVFAPFFIYLSLAINTNFL